MKNKRINAAVYLAAGILLMVGPYTLFRVCDTGDKIMKCFWATRAVNAVGGLIAFGGVLSLALKGREALAAVNLFAAAAGVTAILIPYVLIGGCAKETMACNALTFPAVCLICAAVILFSVVSLIRLRKTEGGA